MGKYRLICILLFLLLFGAGGAWSQISSSAFDPNCYFPRIGVLGEIDTIYGAHHNQGLGGGMINIGPEPGGSYGRISCDLVLDTSADRVIPPSVFTTGPNFDLHHLKVTGNYINSFYIARRSHFRSPKYWDLLAVIDPTGGAPEPARIYWQDDNGNYDTSRYTQLRSSVEGKYKYIYCDHFNIPFTSHISSDSVEDLIYTVSIQDIDSLKIRRYFLYYQGGQHLYDQGKKAIADSTFYFNNQPWPFGTYPQIAAQGDFRGVGRNDFLVYDSQTGYTGNIMHYKNAIPFTMESLLHLDTIFEWSSPNTFQAGWPFFPMRALPKVKGDSSVDLLIYITTGTPVEGIGILRGGKNFDTYQWSLDSLAFLIHHPGYYDSKWQSLTWGGGGVDCGDMTNTGNRVLGTGGETDQGLDNYDFFYVVGNNIDDKADMFIGDIPNHGGTDAEDTLTADHDQYGDIIMGRPGFGMNSASEYNGTIFVLHGSEKIPVSGRTVSTFKPGQNQISVYPNPITTGTCTLDLHSLELQDLDITIWDLLGRKIYFEHIYAPYMRTQHQIFLNSITSGTYTLEVIGKKFNQRIQLSVLK